MVGRNFKRKSGQNTIAIIWVLLSCIASMILAIFIRLQLSPKHIKEIVERALNKNPRVQHKIDNVRLRLSNGWWPEVALIAEEGNITVLDDCNQDVTILFDHIRVPIALTSLLTHPRLDTVYAHKILVSSEKSNRECKEDVKKNAEPSMQIDGKDSVKKELSIGKASKSEYVEFEIAVDELRLVFDKLNDHGVTFRALKLEQDKKTGLEFEGKLIVDDEYGYGVHLPPLKVVGKYEHEKANFNIGGKIREGDVVLSGVWQRQEQKIDLNISLKHLPMSYVAQIANRLKLFKNEWRPKSSWLTAQAKLETTVPEIRHKKWKTNVQALRLEGDVGKVDFSTFNYSNHNHEFSDFNIKGMQLKLNEVLNSFQYEKLSGVVQNYGDLNFECFHQNKKFNCEGELKNSKLQFSRMGHRTLQTISNVDFDFGYNLETLIGDFNLNKIALEDGAYEGKFTLSHDANRKKLTGMWQISQLQFSKQVQKTWFGGEVAPLKLDTHFRYNEGVLDEGVLKLQLPYIKAEDYSLSGIYIQFTAEKGALKAKWNIKDLSFEKENYFYKNFASALMINSDLLVVRNAEGHIVQKENGWILRDTFASIPPNHLLLKADIEWQQDTFSGDLVLNKEQKKVRYQVGGDRLGVVLKQQ